MNGPASTWAVPVRPLARWWRGWARQGGFRDFALAAGWVTAYGRLSGLLGLEK